MPYKHTNELPESVQDALSNVPHAQEIYKEAFNSAWEHYENPDDRRQGTSREEAAHAVAWSAVKQQYRKGTDGSWHPKDS